MDPTAGAQAAQLAMGNAAVSFVHGHPAKHIEVNLLWWGVFPNVEVRVWGAPQNENQRC